MMSLPAMSDVAAGPSRAKKPATTTPRKVASHPSYADMIQQSLSSMKGSASRQALLKYMMKTFNLGQDEKAINTHLKLALNRELDKGMLTQSTGKGATGTVKLSKEAKASATAAAKKTKAAAAGPKAKVAKKAVTPKKVSLSSSKAKKPTLTKKSTAKVVAKPKAAAKKAAVKPTKAKVAKPKVTKAAVGKAKKPAGKK